MFVGTSWMSFTRCSQIPESGHMADGVRAGVHLPKVAPTVQLPPVYRSRCRHMRSLTGVLRTSPPGGDPRRPGAVALRLTRAGRRFGVGTRRRLGGRPVIHVPATGLAAES
jgi:hypothetical protein